MGWKKMLVGEKMPDKDDPKYLQRYENEVKAGRKFARTLKLDVLAIKVQEFANGHKRLFLALVFGFIILSFSFNIYRMVKVYNHQQSTQSATERQEQLMRQRHKKVKTTINNAHTVLPVMIRGNQKNNNQNTENNGCTEED